MLSLWLSSSKNLNIGIVPLTSAGWNEPLGPDPQRHLGNWLPRPGLRVCLHVWYIWCLRQGLFNQTALPFGYTLFARHGFTVFTVRIRDYRTGCADLSFSLIEMCPKILFMNVSNNILSLSLFQKKLQLYSPLPMYKVAIVTLFFEVREWVLERLYSSPKVIQWVRSSARKRKIRFPEPSDGTAPPVGEKRGASTGPLCSQAVPVAGRRECSRSHGCRHSAGASLKKFVDVHFSAVTETKLEDRNAFKVLGPSPCPGFILKSYQGENPPFLPAYFHQREHEFSGYSRETCCGQAQTLQTRTPVHVTAHVVEQFKHGLPLLSTRKGNAAEA